MALPGPAPKDNKVGRTPNADWTEVENVPHEAGRARELPLRRVAGPPPEGGGEAPLVLHPWDEQTQEWWDVVRTLPHAAIWTAADWLFASDTAYLKDSFYRGLANAGEMTEMRRREDLLGLSAEARRKLRIRYRAPRPAAEPDAPAAAVTSLHERRSRRRVIEDEEA